MDKIQFKNIRFIDPLDQSDKIDWRGAVLFLIHEDCVFLIKRSELMPSHAGQLAFFGGNKRADETSPVAVALREFSEESSLSLHHVDVLGTLPAVWTARGQSVIPVLAHWKSSVEDFFKEVKSNGEWDQCFAMPWSIISNESRWDYSQRIVDQVNPVLFFPFQSSECYRLHPREESHLLWGATGRMIWDFLRLYFNTKS